MKIKPEILKKLTEFREGSFYIKTLGCRVNQSESEEIAFLLKKIGLKQLEQPGRAKISILNTCAVTGEAEAKARKEARKLIRMGSELVLIIGCGAELIKNAISSDKASEVFYLSNKMKKDLIENLKVAAGSIYVPYSGVRTRAFLKIQDGCNQRCSYCIVPLLRGNEESYPSHEILRKIELFKNLNIKEVVLTGVHLGRYEAPDKKNYYLTNLLKDIVKIGGVRIRLSSIDVFEINEDLVETVAEFSPSICPHFHIPLQSGSDKILKKMRRPYTAESFLKTVEMIRGRIKPAAISTDVMVGFPGETDDDFKKTIEIIKAARFMRIHTFRYSKRPGTEASEFSEQIPEQVKKIREKEVIRLSKELENEFKKELSGNLANVLIEKCDSHFSFGRTEYYVDVKIKEQLKKGSIYTVKLNYREGELYGEVLK